MLNNMPNLQSDYLANAKILSHAMQILSTRWTNRGYKIKQDDGSHKFCILGAINQATQDLYSLDSNSSHLSQIYLQSCAIKYFGISFVSVNDERGLPALFRLMSITLERLLTDAPTNDPNFRPSKFARGREVY